MALDGPELWIAVPAPGDQVDLVIREEISAEMPGLLSAFRLERNREGAVGQVDAQLVEEQPRPPALSGW